MLLYGPGIVGGLVIPILGAIPDCAVILISGMGEGTTEEVQNQLSVGVGTLVGSTVMLLTIPWGIGVFLGRRDYDEVTDAAAHTPERKPKHTHTSLWTNCVTTLPEIPSTSRIMILSLVGYLIIQLPSFSYSTDKDGGVVRERPWAFGCMIFSGVAFLIYCYMQVRGAESAELERRKQEALRREQWKAKLDRSLGERHVQEMVFRMYDKDNSGFIEPEELSRALAHLGLQVGRKDLSALFESIDVGHEHDGDAGKADGRISLAEFGAAVKMWVDAGQNSINLREKEEQHKSFRLRKEDVKNSVSYGAIEAGAGHKVDDDDEEEEEEEYCQKQTITAQQPARNELRRRGLVRVCNSVCSLVLGSLSLFVFVVFPVRFLSLCVFRRGSERERAESEGLRAVVAGHPVRHDLLRSDGGRDHASGRPIGCVAILHCLRCDAPGFQCLRGVCRSAVRAQEDQ